MNTATANCNVPNVSGPSVPSDDHQRGELHQHRRGSAGEDVGRAGQHGTTRGISRLIVHAHRPPGLIGVVYFRLHGSVVTGARRGLEPGPEDARRNDPASLDLATLSQGTGHARGERPDRIEPAGSMREQEEQRADLASCDRDDVTDQRRSGIRS